MIGEEPRLAYNRVLLSSVLAGDVPVGEIELKPAEWWRDRGVTLLYGPPRRRDHRGARRVTLADGATLPFAKLVFATGSQPIRLPMPGSGAAGRANIPRSRRRRFDCRRQPAARARS